jgi:AcrR family transcriptional regulator
MVSTDRRRIHGERTRRDILDAAVRLAANKGLEGATIGLLARELGMSKAGIFGHFGSKEALQLATIDEAHASLVRDILAGAGDASGAIDRLRGMLDGYLDHVREEAKSGGHFFTTVLGEFASRPGKVRERLAAIQREWHALIAGALRHAVAQRELPSDADVEQLAFEIVALAQGACNAHSLFGEPVYLERARAALERLVDAHRSAVR